MGVLVHKIILKEKGVVLYFNQDIFNDQERSKVLQPW